MKESKWNYITISKTIILFIMIVLTMMGVYEFYVCK